MNFRDFLNEEKNIKELVKEVRKIVGKGKTKFGEPVEMQTSLTVKELIKKLSKLDAEFEKYKKGNKTKGTIQGHSAMISDIQEHNAALFIWK